jgi:PAS domain S-box-containing protein
MTEAFLREPYSGRRLNLSIQVLVAIGLTFTLTQIAQLVWHGHTQAPPSIVMIDLFMVSFLAFSILYVHRKVRAHHSRREKVYANLFRRNPQPMWIYDLQTYQFLIVNDAARSLYGYTKEEFLSMTIKDIRPAEDVPALVSIAGRPNGGYNKAGIWRHHKKDGELMYVEISSHQIIFNGRKAELVMAYNVTDKVNQEKNLQELNKDLERRIAERTENLLQLNYRLTEQNRMIKAKNQSLYSMTRQLKAANENISRHTELKNKFVSMVSHEFRTPLASIRFSAGYVKRYYAQISQEIVMTKMAEIESHINHMVNLLEDVLTIGKSDAVKIEVNPDQIDIREFAGKISQEVQCCIASLGIHEHKIKVDISPAVPDKLLVDGKLLRNIFINLLTNAIKYSPDKDVVLFKVDLEGENIVFQVTDYGIGMNKEEQEKIFEPFYRTNSCKELPGTGLGLAIVKKAADLLQAQIDVISEPGEGSTFTVTLPHRRCQHAA